MIFALAVDLNRHIVQIGNSHVERTPNEYELLKVLVLNAGRLLTQLRLADQVSVRSPAATHSNGWDTIQRTPAETGSQPTRPFRASPNKAWNTAHGLSLSGRRLVSFDDLLTPGSYLLSLI